MSGLWAYFNTGRPRHQDIWDWVRPHDMMKDTRAGKAIDGFYGILHMGGYKVNSLAESMNYRFIAFDGKKWLVAHYGLPNAYLDEKKYPLDHFSHEERHGTKGRRLYWMQGYASASKELPEHIPNLDKATLAALHEQHILPIWELKNSHTIKPTAYEAIGPGGIKLSEYLPPEAMEKLKAAHAAGRPVMLQYNEATREVIDHSKGLAARIEKAKPKAQEKNATGKAAIEVKPAAKKNAGKAGKKIEKSFAERTFDFKNTKGELRWGKVTGVSVGAALVAGGLYLWLDGNKNTGKTSWTERSADQLETTRHIG